LLLFVVDLTLTMAWRGQGGRDRAGVTLDRPTLLAGGHVVVERDNVQTAPGTDDRVLWWGWGLSEWDGARWRAVRRRVGDAAGLVAFAAADHLLTTEAVAQVGAPAHSHAVLSRQRSPAVQVAHAIVLQRHFRFSAVQHL